MPSKIIKHYKTVTDQTQAQQTHLPLDKNTFYTFLLKHVFSPTFPPTSPPTSAYLNNQQTSPGIHLGVQSFSRLYRSLFTIPSAHREGKFHTMRLPRSRLPKRGDGRTDGRTDKRTDLRTDTPSYKDAWLYLKSL